MTKETATYEVTEGTTMLEGRPVTAGDKVEMTAAQALYHAGLGRLKLAQVAKPQPRAKSGRGSAREPATAQADSDGEGDKG